MYFELKLFSCVMVKGRQLGMVATNWDKVSLV